MIAEFASAVGMRTVPRSFRMFRGLGIRESMGGVDGVFRVSFDDVL